MSLNEKVPEIVKLHKIFTEIGFEHAFLPPTSYEDGIRGSIILNDEKGNILIEQNQFDDGKLQVDDGVHSKFVSLKEICKLLTD